MDIRKTQNFSYLLKNFSKYLSMLIFIQSKTVKKGKFVENSHQNVYIVFFENEKLLCFTCAYAYDCNLVFEGKIFMQKNKIFIGFIQSIFSYSIVIEERNNTSKRGF